MCDSAMTLRYSERDQTHYTVVLLTASVQLVTDLDRQAFIESGPPGVRLYVDGASILLGLLLLCVIPTGSACKCDNLRTIFDFVDMTMCGPACGV